jgi:hypothetical protein
LDNRERSRSEAKVPITDNQRWGRSWLIQVAAIALHVIDEAVFGFLPVYNSAVDALRDAYSWVWLPTFDAASWLTGLMLGIVVLLALSYPVFAGKTFMRPVSYFVGWLMVLNCVGHIAASLYFNRPIPGVASSPILILAAVSLLTAMPRRR